MYKVLKPSIMMKELHNFVVIMAEKKNQQLVVLAAKNLESIYTRGGRLLPYQVDRDDKLEDLLERRA